MVLDRLLALVATHLQGALAFLPQDAGQAADDAAAAGDTGGLDLDEALSDPGGLVEDALAWLQSPEGGIALGIALVKAIVIWIVFKFVAGFVAKLLTRALSSEKLKASDLLKDFLVNSARKVIMLIGLVVIIGMFGVDTAGLVAGLGVAGFVIGFALQDTLGNFAAGIMILLYRPYDVGDVVEVAGQTGKVDAMSLVSTVLLTPDNQVLTVPNGSIWGGVIRNVTAKDTRRVDMVFGIGYSDDIAKARGVLEELVKGHDKVLADPAPTIEVSELADSSVNFVVRPWSKTADYWGVYFDLHRQVKERFDKEQISIPFPQRDVHVHNAD